MSAPEQHALLSASGSHQWIHCTRSPRLEEQFPESTSEFAEAGRVAHELAELKARNYFIETLGKRAVNSRIKKITEKPYYDTGMATSTDEYLEALKEEAMGFGDALPFVALETRVNYSDYAPEGFGTADCIMIGSGRVVVIDYKNGSGVPVEAENNSQMMLYALGALKLYAPIYGATIQAVRLKIVQPNSGGVKFWDTDRATLERWGDSIVKPAAQLAWAGEGDFVPGDWCRFCRAGALCRARAQDSSRITAFARTLPPLLTDTEVGDRLALAAPFESYIKDLKEYALKSELDGKDIPGFKVVEGRGSRDWLDLDSAFLVLPERGVDAAMLWERKPVTPPALEKTLGKKTFGEIAEDLVVKNPGKPALVPDSDPRKPYNAAAIAFGDAVCG